MSYTSSSYHYDPKGNRIGHQEYPIVKDLSSGSIQLEKNIESIYEMLTSKYTDFQVDSIKIHFEGGSDDLRSLFKDGISHKIDTFRKAYYNDPLRNRNWSHRFVSLSPILASGIAIGVLASVVGVVVTLAAVTLSILTIVTLSAIEQKSLLRGLSVLNRLVKIRLNTIFDRLPPVVFTETVGAGVIVFNETQMQVWKEEFEQKEYLLSQLGEPFKRNRLTGNYPHGSEFIVKCSNKQNHYEVCYFGNHTAHISNRMMMLAHKADELKELKNRLLFLESSDHSNDNRLKKRDLEIDVQKKQFELDRLQDEINSETQKIKAQANEMKHQLKKWVKSHSNYTFVDYHTDQSTAIYHWLSRPTPHEVSVPTPFTPVYPTYISPFIKRDMI